MLLAAGDDEVLQLEEVCSFFPLIQALAEGLYDTCEDLYVAADVNQNAVGGLWEALQVTAPIWGLDAQKAAQLDCSGCLTDP